MKSTTSHRHALTRKVAIVAAGLAMALPLTMTAPVAAKPGDGHSKSTHQHSKSHKTHAHHKNRSVDAAKHRDRGKPISRSGNRASAGARALAAARTRTGMPYSYGATGPSAFDCSGLTGWAYAQAGKHLPRTSDAQAAATIRVSTPQVGDLVFFHNGGDVYHVGLWVSPGQVFHSSRPGTPVSQGSIWTSSVFYGRVR